LLTERKKSFDCLPLELERLADDDLRRCLRDHDTRQRRLDAWRVFTGDVGNADAIQPRFMNVLMKGGRRT
jgi:hypothetical protein